ncbi:UbiA prenyltransferase family protein [Halocola ammonii]
MAGNSTDQPTFLKRALSLLVFSNLWIAFGAFLWTLGTYFIFEFKINYLVPSFVGSATLFTYNFQRLVKLHLSARRISDRNRWIKERKPLITLLTIVGGSATFVLTFFLQASAIWLLIPLGIISIGYALEFFPTKKKTVNLRSLPGTKIILISLTWSIATVLLPAITETSQILAEHYIFTLERFLFVMAITIPFDIRDLRYDKPRMKTLPQVLGIKGSLWLATFLLIGSSLLDFWLFAIGIFPLCVFFGLLGSYFTAILLVTFTNHHRPETYFTGLLDGLFAFQFALLFLFCFFN